MATAPPSNWKPIIVELWDLIHSEAGWAEAFELAVQQARSYGVPEMKDITNTVDYCNFMNALLSWIPTESEDGRAVYYKICLSYFILDQPALMRFQSQIHPTTADKPLTTLSQWIVKYAKSIGKDWLDTPASITAESIKSFYNAPSYHMDDYIYPKDGWKTFNEFFAREVKPGKRPIDGETDPSVIVSPADSTFDGHWSVNDGLVDFGAEVRVKGVPWRISDLLKGSKYADAFKNGTFMHSFLNTNDYHRQHAPVSGTVVEAYNIEGAAYLEVVVKDENNAPVSFNPRRPLTFSSNNRFVMQRKIINPHPTPIEAPKDGTYSEMEALDMPGYQFLQLRGMIVIDSPIGLVAVLPIGMAQVSSVVINVKKDQKVKKGEEISLFQFGGSDVVIVFEEGCRLNLTAQVGQHYNMGREIGRGTVPQKH